MKTLICFTQVAFTVALLTGLLIRLPEAATINSVKDLPVYRARLLWNADGIASRADVFLVPTANFLSPRREKIHYLAVNNCMIVDEALCCEDLRDELTPVAEREPVPCMCFAMFPQRAYNSRMSTLLSGHTLTGDLNRLNDLMHKAELAHAVGLDDPVVQNLTRRLLTSFEMLRPEVRAVLNSTMLSHWPVSFNPGADAVIDNGALADTNITLATMYERLPMRYIDFVWPCACDALIALSSDFLFADAIRNRLPIPFHSIVSSATRVEPEFCNVPAVRMDKRRDGPTEDIEPVAHSKKRANY